MPYGKLTSSQETVLSKYVRGQVVTDLGSGDLDLARRLLGLGAKHVRCIDKEPKPHLKRWPANLSYDQAYFHNLKNTAPMDVVFLAWPINHQTSLEAVIEKAQVVAYLGKNTDGSACGTVGLFQSLIQRELLDYVPDHQNCLVVVGKQLPEPRRPTGEELAGISSFSDYFSYTEAEHYASCPHWKPTPIQGFAV